MKRFLVIVFVLIISAPSVFSQTKDDFAFFVVDFLYWNNDSANIAIKKRAMPLTDEIYQVLDYAKNSNHKLVYTTCCSAPMPTETDMQSIGGLFVPLEAENSGWKKFVDTSQLIYVHKRAFGNWKINHDRKCSDMFLHNKNIPELINLIGVKHYYIIGDAFEECTVNAIEGMIENGCTVTVIEDMVIPYMGNNQEQRQEVRRNLESKGVDFVKLNDLFTSLENKTESVPKDIKVKKGKTTDKRDGHVYKTIEINSSVWMAENLTYETEKSHYYDNNLELHKRHGRLYDIMADSNLCPTGWHIPTIAEWTELVDYIGGSEIAGQKLKSKDTWNTSDFEGTDEFFFDAPASGFYDVMFDSCILVGTNVTYWVMPEPEKNKYEYITLYYDIPQVIFNDAYRAFGFSVRCKKDDE